MAARPQNPRRLFADRAGLRRLPGGARLAVLANPHAPTVTVAGTLQAGLGWVRDGRFTVAGLTAAMLDRGTRSFDRLRLARALEDHGLQIAVRTSSSAATTVAFSAQGLAEELPRLARLLIEILRRPTFPAPELDRLRKRVLGALVKEREETHALAYAALTRHLFPAGHPLHRRHVEERERELKALDRGDLESFHAAAYGPGKLVMAVVGEVDPDSTAALFGELLADWTAVPDEPPEWPAVGDHGAGEERVHLPDRPALDVFLGHAGRLRRCDPDFPAAVLANSCLGQSTLTSRLGLEVRDKQGLTYGVYSRFFGTLGLPGPWATSLSVAADNLERAVAASRQVIADYVEQGPGEQELADERTARAGAYRVGLATNGGVARELVTVMTAGQEVAHLDRYPEALLEVEREQVMAAISRHFRPDQLVLTVAGTLNG